MSTTSLVIDPKDPPAPICSVPALIRAPPLNVLAPVRMVTPAPFCRTWPLPEMAPLKVRLLLWLNTSTPLSTTAPATEPVVPPVPRSSSPLIVVTPENGLSLVKVTTPPEPPELTMPRLPEPLIWPA